VPDGGPDPHRPAPPGVLTLPAGRVPPDLAAILFSLLSPSSADVEARPELARAYRVNSYPTMVFLDPTGEEVRRVNGFLPAQVLLDRMRKSLPLK